MKRVYHPRLNAYEDVADDRVATWVEHGWLEEQPDHVTVPDDAPAPGEHPGIASVTKDVPLLEDTTPTSTRKGGKGSRGSRSAATSSTVTGTAPTT